MSALSEQESYQAALSLGLETRYEEAAEKLREILREHPQHVPSLILLGKVEFYLRRFSSSRQRFQQALTLEPENPAAWFALQYYSQRSRTVWLLGAAGFFFGLLALMGALFFHSLRRGVDSDLKGTEQRLSGRLFELERSVAEQTESRRSIDEALLRRMEALSQALEREGDRLEALERRTEEAFTSVNGRLGELATLQSELHLELRADIRELRRLIGELRAR